MFKKIEIKEHHRGDFGGVDLIAEGPRGESVRISMGSGRTCQETWKRLSVLCSRALSSLNRMIELRSAE
jgi:hypothetical protein